MKRFRIEEMSMAPTLTPGVEVMTTDSRRAAIGDIVVFEHPDRRGFWLVKRRVEPPQPIGGGQAWVMSDNPEATRADSRSFGAIPIEKLLPVTAHLDDATFREACTLLAEEDPKLGAALDAYGRPSFWSRPPGFATLVLLILEQQVSLESGAAVYERLLAQVEEVIPESIASLGPKRLRDIGVTRQKADYIDHLSHAHLGGEFDVNALGELPPAEARDALLRQRGIGPWTADAYLLSALVHIDVFPTGDRALQVGAAEVLGLQAAPDADKLELVAEPWRPIRATAARIIWHAYLSRRGRTEPGDRLLDAPPPDMRRVGKV